MFNVKISLFSGTRELENKIDEMHDKIIESSLYFKEAFEIYIKEKRSQNYRRASKKIKVIEAKADDLRREIESRLYAQNLIPDLRADVLQMIENIDKVINEFDEVAHKFYIEQPDSPLQYQDKFRVLINQVSECAENMAIASRAFFRDFACFLFTTRYDLLNTERNHHGIHVSLSRDGLSDIHQQERQGYRNPLRGEAGEDVPDGFRGVPLGVWQRDRNAADREMLPRKGTTW